MNYDEKKFRCYVILLDKKIEKFPEELVRAHVEHLKRLDKKGQFVLGGPFSDYNGGMVIIKADSFEEAKSIAEEDPFIKSGAESYHIRTVELSCEENNHMGMG